jgi:nucleoside-diphosphate-sugar epimerase
MRVFVAGATGVVGVRLVPELVRRGHEVVGTTRTPSKVDRLRRLGAEPVVVDAFDGVAVKEAVARAEPEVVVHELTDLGMKFNPRRIDRMLENTNRLRTEGLDHLLEAARSMGARRFVAQSYAAWPYARVGGPVKTEEDPLDPHPPEGVRAALDAIRYLESAVTGSPDLEGLALRYGGFYGPGTSLGEGGDVLEAVRKRRFPIVGDGGGVWSFLHVDDAATATAAAIEGGAPGIYNVCDDEPATVAEWMPVLAEAIGARAPRHAPVWLARLLAGEAGVVLMTEIRGASNEKAKGELGWRPRFATWREGFRSGLE